MVALIPALPAIVCDMPNAMPNREDKRRHLDKEALDELTVKGNCPPDGSTRTVFDSEIPSFAVRISPKGMATFCMIYSFGGRIQRFKIDRLRTADMAGRASGRGITIAEARKKAMVLRARIDEGENIAADKTKARADAKAEHSAKLAEAEHRRRKSEATFGALLLAYVEHLKAADKPSWKQVDGAVARHITDARPKLAKLPAEDVTVDDVMPVFHALAKAGKLREAEKLRSYLRAAYTAARKARTDATMHAFAGFKITANPLSDLDVSRPKEAADKAAKAAKERKWALSQSQLAAYWKRIAADDSAHGAALRFHLLTGGQRVEQLSRLTEDGFDPSRKMITLLDTKGRRKMAREHAVPLIPDALRALETMRGDAGPYLFTVSGGKHGAVYHTLADSMREVATAMVKAKEVPKRFTPGTIRKTVESRLQEAGVSREIRAHLGSHGLGGVQGQHYETHDFLAEKRAALLKLRHMLDEKPKRGRKAA